MSDIRDSISGAMDQVAEIDQFLGVELPNPVSVDNVDPEKAAAAEKKKTEPERRRDSLKRAAKAIEDRETGKGKKAADKEPRTSADRTEDNKLRRSIIEKYMSAEDNRPDPKSLNSKEAREHRHALRAKFPNTNLGEIFSSFEQWDADFQKDPVGTREKLLAHYLKTSPESFGKAQPREYEQGLRGSLQRALENQQDMEELAPHIEKHGKQFTNFMRQLVELDAGMTTDPAVTSARLAANYGAPATELQAQQHAEQQRAQEATRAKPLHERTPEEHRSYVDRALDLIVQHHDDPSVNLPGMNTDAMQHAVADALNNHIPRTADPMADLRAAHAWVVQQQGNNAAEIAKRMERGSKSISGAPSHGPSPAQRGSGSVGAAVSRAAGSI